MRFMKTIIYNSDYLEEKDINKTISRAKVLLYNSKDEILLAYSHKNYFLVGGHLEDNETFVDCIKREVLEEVGIELEIGEVKPYYVIEYLCKDYPEVGDNTRFVIKYFSILTDSVVDISKVKLTDSEKDGNFEVRYIHKDLIIDELNKSLEACTKKVVVNDTIEAVSEFLKL